MGALPSRHRRLSAAIHPETSIGTVRLAVGDADRVRDYYERVVGLRTLAGAGDEVRLGAEGGEPIVELVERPDAPPRPPRSTGLFHMAILLPDRAELARALQRIAAARVPSGGSDHLVSEAIYLRDPEGNGIEIYRDRPREEWARAGDAIRMDTLPLDVQDVLGELDDPAGEPQPAAAGTRMGHVHLQVAELDATERFYHGTLGFDVTVRTYPGALFMSAGGYHHHIGANTWAGENAPPPPPGALGMEWFAIVVPDGELDRVEQRLAAAGVEATRDGGTLRVADPSANGVVLRSAS